MPRENGSISSSADRAFCDSVLPGVSRTFALSIALLPSPLCDSIGTAYLLCRIVDCIEDEHDLADADRARLFDEFDALMVDDARDGAELERQSESLRLGANADERRLMAGAGAVLRCYRRLSRDEREAIRPHVLEMSSGMRDFSTREGFERIRDIEELERYCYFVAGTVGKLLTGLFSLDIGLRPTDDRMEQSIRFGLGLQLVNVVRDVCEDAARGISFLPHALAQAQGVALSGLFDPANRDAAVEVAQTLCERASAHLGVAEAYTLSWPAQAAAHVRLFCAVPLALAHATLAMLRTQPDLLISGETPKISRAAVAEAVRQAEAGKASDDALRSLFRAARDGRLQAFAAA